MRKWRETVNWVRVGLLSTITVSLAAADTPPERAKLLNEQGLGESERGDYSAARAHLSEALGIWRSLGPNFNPHIAIELINLAEVACGEGNWGEGATLFEQALERSRSAFGPRHMTTITAMNRLANVSVVRGEFERAEALYREALAAGRELYPNDLQTAYTLAGLSYLHSREGRQQEALAEAEEALSLTLQAAGENSSEAGAAYANVAQIHRLAGNLDRAVPLLRKARAILERTLGPQHPRSASALSQEGLILMYEGKLTEAEREMVHAVELLSVQRASNVNLAVAEQNLGLLRLRQKKYTEADRLFSGALALEEQYAARPNAEMADTLRLLSEVREKERRFEEADSLKARAATISSYR